MKRAPLPVELQPKSIDEGHAIQDATMALLNATVGGWKVGLDKTGAMSRAPILKEVIQTNPGRVGIERHATCAASRPRSRFAF